MITSKMTVKAEQNGIPKSVLNKRIERGWSVERATTQPIKRTNDLINRYLRRAKENGISEITFKRRIYALRWDLEDASTRPIYETGNFNRSYLKQCDENGIPRPTYYDRIYKGWDKEEASTLPPYAKRGVRNA